MTFSETIIYEYLPYLSIWESELEHMCGMATNFSNKETGSECFGLHSHGGRLVIMFVTPPGRKATHQSTLFCQDIPFLTKSSRYLSEKYGLNLIGTQHSHHNLKIESLSPGDIRSIHAIASKNGYTYMCQILLTFAESKNYTSKSIEAYPPNTYSENRNFRALRDGKSFNSSRREGAHEKTHNSGKKIKIQAYVYSDAQNGQPVSCPIKVIPGLSPIRRSITLDDSMPELHHFYQFPKGDMIYEPLTSSSVGIKKEFYLPSEILDAIDTLPDTILGKLQFRRINDELLLVELPVEDSRKTLLLIYKSTPHYSLQMASLLSDGGHTDVTKQIKSDQEKNSLASLYLRCEELLRISHQKDTELNQCDAEQLKVNKPEMSEVHVEAKEPIERCHHDSKRFSTSNGS